MSSLTPRAARSRPDRPGAGGPDCRQRHHSPGGARARSMLDSARCPRLPPKAPLTTGASAVPLHRAPVRPPAAAGRLGCPHRSRSRRENHVPRAHPVGSRRPARLFDPRPRRGRRPAPPLPTRFRRLPRCAAPSRPREASRRQPRTAAHPPARRRRSDPRESVRVAPVARFRWSPMRPTRDEPRRPRKSRGQLSPVRAAEPARPSQDWRAHWRGRAWRARCGAPWSPFATSCAAPP
jgi:hypothetical protein